MMQYYVTHSEHVKNSIIDLCANVATVQKRSSDDAFIIPVCDCGEAMDQYAHLVEQSDPSWFQSKIVQSVNNALSGVAHIYPRLGF